MITNKLFHEICKRNGLAQCGQMNKYKFPAWNNKFGGCPVATWFKTEKVTVYVLTQHERNGIKQWVSDPYYQIEDPVECEARIKDTFIAVKNLCQELKLKSISRYFD